MDEVQGIHRVSWTEIMKPSTTMAGGMDGVSTGIVKKDDKLIIILDLERIIAEINPEVAIKLGDVQALAGRKRIDIPILIAEDSALLNRLIVQALETAGYTDLTHTENGQQAWDLINEWKEKGILDRKVQCVITDIEMPVMDGHRLTRLIKTDEELSWLKVVIFSSMINDDLRRKGEQLGADAQLTKPEIGSLVSAVDKLLGVS